MRDIQRFHAPTSREALAKARIAFGDGTLILSNRPTVHGVEVIATSDNAFPDIPMPRASSSKTAGTSRRLPEPAAPLHSSVEEDADQLTMSTLSFQDYVRERVMRRQHEAATQPAPEISRAPAAPAPAPASRLHDAPPPPIRVAIPQPVVKPRPAAKPRQAAMAAPAMPAVEAPSMPAGIATELHAMKEMIEDRFNTLAWLGQTRQSPIQLNLMTKLIRAGYSPALARAILSKMPEKISASESVRWVMNILAHNLKTDDEAEPLHVEGGIYALVGSTGVGKTTTAAKLAGLCAQVHGPGSVGLITLDTYRIGAHEQLRSYGRMMGVVAHLAYDREALQDLLSLLSNKKLVLIDTSGAAPRDPRIREMQKVLNMPQIQRLLVLNAGGHGDTLDTSVSAFRSSGVQQAILSKVDEAAKLGPVLDATIRHQLVLRGITTGQKVPEDWEAANAAKLVRMSMRAAPGKSAFDPLASDLGFFFSQATAPHAASDALHA
jgi:flagellar biosynthesis protein FlhF